MRIQRLKCATRFVNKPRYIRYTGIDNNSFIARNHWKNFGIYNIRMSFQFVSQNVYFSASKERRILF